MSKNAQVFGKPSHLPLAHPVPSVSHPALLTAASHAGPVPARSQHVQDRVAGEGNSVFFTKLSGVIVTQKLLDKE